MYSASFICCCWGCCIWGWGYIWSRGCYYWSMALTWSSTKSYSTILRIWVFLLYRLGSKLMTPYGLITLVKELTSSCCCAWFCIWKLLNCWALVRYSLFILILWELCRSGLCMAPAPSELGENCDAFLFDSPEMIELKETGSTSSKALCLMS